MSLDGKKPTVFKISPPKDSNLNSQLTQQDIVTVLVDSGKSAFRLPKSFLRSKVPYFETSLKDCWNGSTNEVVLNDVNKAVFEVFVDYLYEDKIPSYFEDAYSAGFDVRDMVILYSFADRLMFLQMKNDLIDLEMKLLSKACWTLQGLKHVCRAELINSALYRLALGSLVSNLLTTHPKWEEINSGIEEILNYPDVVKDLFRSICEQQRGEQKRPIDCNPCEFHDHTDGSCCT